MSDKVYMSEGTVVYKFKIEEETVDGVDCYKVLGVEGFWGGDNEYEGTREFYLDNSELRTKEEAFEEAAAFALKAWDSLKSEFPDIGDRDKWRTDISANRYLELHNSSGFSIGDKVKVIRSVRDDEEGWKAPWLTKMYQYIGQEGVVIMDNGVFGFLVTMGDDSCYEYPYFVLEKVEEVEQ